MTKEKKNKIWKYSPFHSYKFVHEGKTIETTMQSQLYQVGIYVILNNNPALQFSADPEGMIKAEKKLRKDEIKGTITDLYFSPAIRITEDKDGFLIQLKDE